MFNRLLLVFLLATFAVGVFEEWKAARLDESLSVSVYCKNYEDRVKYGFNERCLSTENRLQNNILERLYGRLWVFALNQYVYLESHWFIEKWYLQIVVALVAVVFLVCLTWYMNNRSATLARLELELVREKNYYDNSRSQNEQNRDMFKQLMEKQSFLGKSAPQTITAPIIEEIQT
jgi:hypothetical protein